MAPSGTPERARRADSGLATAPAGLAGLGNRFVELFGRKLSRRSFAVETARLIAEAVRLRAVAVLGYDRRRDRLVLLAEHGLRPEARLVLGGGADCTWDIPMRGLRNRRIAVVEAAHQNPFVPPSLVELSPAGLCIASVPLYYDYDPVGVVLLFAAGSRAFPDTHLQTLSQALRVCARGLRDASGPAVRPPRQQVPDEGAEARARAPGEATPAADTGRDAGAAAAAQSAVEAAQQTAALAARVQQLEDELRRAREEVERSAQTARSLTAAANAATRERDSMGQQLADAERAREVEATELRTQVAALEERLLAVDSERARYQRVAEARHAAASQSVQKLEGERDALTARVTAAEAITAGLQTQLTAERAERERLAAQVELLTAQLRAGAEALERTQARYAQERAITEADRDAWKDQATTLRAQLAERSESLGGLDRELRSTVIARDAAASQLQAARAEVDRLAALSEELSLRATQFEAGRAAALAEGAALQRALEEERSSRQGSEDTLRTDLTAARREAERIATEAAAVMTELGERRRAVAARDEQLATLRGEHDASLQAIADTQQANAELRTEVATLSARLDQGAIERQQLLDERGALRTALSDTRQRAAQADVAHAAAVGQLQAETVELRRQVEMLGSEHGALNDRLQRAVEDGRDLTVRLAEAQRRNGDLHELLRQRDEGLEQLARERETLAAQVAASVGQLQAAQEIVERTRAAAVQDRSALEAERNAWQEQATAARHELAQHAERLVNAEHDLRSTSVARDAAATELQGAQAEVERLAALADELAHARTRLEADRAARTTESADLRHALDEERTARAESERALRADLVAARTEAERLTLALTARQEELGEGTRLLAERDQRLATLRREVDALRQQSTDRGVLARQASELGSRVVELEQALAVAHGDAARAERQRAALEERLEATRRREADTAAAASQERSALQEALQRLTDEHAQADADNAALRGEIDGLRAAQAEIQALLDTAGTERARALDEGRAAIQRLSAAEQRLEETDTALRERETALAATRAEREHLAAQLAAATEQLRSAQEAVDSARRGDAEEHAALTAERDRWQEQASLARAEAERLAALSDELQRHAVHADEERATLATELATVRRAYEEERGASRRAAEAHDADLAAARAEGDRRAADVTALRAELAERDHQLDALREREEAAQQTEGEWQRERLALRAEITALTAQIEERAAECQQLREGRTALEHQLALVTATQGEAEQVLAQGLDAARTQITRLEADRATLSAALAESRQRLGQAESAHEASAAQLDGEVTKLRRQMQSLTAARTKQTQRLEEAEQALAAHAAQLAEERARTHELMAQRAQLEQAMAAAAAQRAVVDADLVRARAEVGTLTARAEDSAATAQALRDERDALERELALVRAERVEQQQALTQQLRAARQQVAELEHAGTNLQAELAETQRRVADGNAAQQQVLEQVRAEAATLRQELEQQVASRQTLSERLQEAEQLTATQAKQAEEAGQRAAALAEQSALLEQSLRAGEERRATLETRLTQAQAEIEALHQQSEDRGVLAHQASELGRTVVDLEQQLAALRGDLARAERERAALIEELGEARRLQGEADAVAEQRYAALQAVVERLSDDQRGLEADNAAQHAEADSLRAMLAAERAAREESRAEAARARAEEQDATRRLSEMHRRLEGLSTVLTQRDATVEAANAERQRLTAQVAKLANQLRGAQETLETVQGRTALERAPAESERDVWKAQAAAARAEVERLSTLAAELTETATQLESARSTASTEGAALRRALDEARTSHRQAEAALRADLVALQAEVERLSADAVEQRTLVSGRDEQLEALRREQQAARARDAEWQQTTAALRAEVTALTAQLQDSSAEGQHLRDAREALQREVAAATAARTREEHALLAAREQVGRLEDERAALREMLDATRQHISQMETAHAAALEELQNTTTELRSQLATTGGERAALNERLQRAEQAVVAHTARAEKDREEAAALAGRCTQLEQALAAAETRRAGRDAELAKTRAEIEALRQQSADRGALAHEASELGSRVRQLQEELAAQQADRTRLDRQRAALEEQLRTVEEQHAGAAAAAEREQAALREALAQLQQERWQLEADRAERVTAAETLRTQVTELRATVGEFTVECERVREERQGVAEHLSETQQRMADLSELLKQRDALIQTVNAERERSADAARTAERAAAEVANERDELRRTLAELTSTLERERLVHAEEKAVLARDLTSQIEHQGRAATARHDIESATAPAAESEAVQEAAPRYQGPLVIERSAPLGAVGEAAPEVLDVSLEPQPGHKAVIPSGELVLLDEGVLRDNACAALKGAGFEVVAFAPTEAGVDEMLRRKVKCVMLNLGSGAPAWHTLRVLRERVGSRNLPILAYVMSKDGSAGFCLGRTDFALWPMDPARLLERLGRLRPKLRRLLALSSDVDGMGRLREPLAQARISTSIVLDGKQALEFATMVEPEAAMLHLSPNCPSASRALAGLRATEATRDLPLMLLLDKAPVPREDTFFTATTVQLLAKPSFQFTNLPEEIARVIG